MEPNKMLPHRMHKANMACVIERFPHALRPLSSASTHHSVAFNLSPSRFAAQTLFIHLNE